MRDKTTVTIALFNDTASAMKSWCNDNDITFNQLMRQITNEWRQQNIRPIHTQPPVNNKEAYSNMVKNYGK